MPSVNRFEYSHDLMIWVMFFIYLFELDQVNPFPAWTAPFPLICFFQIYLLHLKLNCLLIIHIKSLAKGIATFVCLLVLFSPNYQTKEPKDLPDWIILDIWTLVSFISVNILFAKKFLNLVVCLGVRNNSFGYSLFFESYTDLFLIKFLIILNNL